jgi:hypothetical protein
MSSSWMALWKYFQWSLDFLVAWPFWFVTLALSANLGASLTLQWPFRRGRWKKEYWLVFINYLFIPVLLAIGVIAALDPAMVPRPRPNTLAVWASNGLFVASLLLGIYWVYRRKGTTMVCGSNCVDSAMDSVWRRIHCCHGTQRRLALVSSLFCRLCEL